MAPITTTPVLVTGANGFLGAWCTKTLLDAGYSVRGTVRNPDDPKKTGHLTGLDRADGALELFKADLLDADSFDDAVAGVEYVWHTASPYTMTVANPQKDLLEPAVNGTLSVLKAAKKAGTVKRVVLTSSVAAVLDEFEAGRTYTEADWNEKSSLKRLPYYYSKVMAEKAAWKFMEDEKPGFTLVVANPFMVVGPSLSPGTNASNAVFTALTDGSYPLQMDLTWGMVDVRDVARAHLVLMENGDAEGRLLLNAEMVPLPEVCKMMQEVEPKLKLPSMMMPNCIAKLASYTQPSAIGFYIRNHVGRKSTIDHSKSTGLGVTYRPIKETVTETVRDMIERGEIKVKN